MFGSSSPRASSLAYLPLVLLALALSTRSDFVFAQQAAGAEGGKIVHARRPSPAILAEKKQAASARDKGAVVAASKEAAPGSFDGPPQLPHPHKVYVDTVDGKLYWPADKPFWVRLAVSPDDNAPSFLLPKI